jgi:hypothetical protein
VSKLQPLLSVVFPYPQRIHNTHTIESFTFFYFLFSLFFSYFFRWPSISQKSFCQKKKVKGKKKTKVHTGKGTTIDPMIFNRS